MNFQRLSKRVEGKSQDPAKTGHHECSSSRLCAAAPVVASSSLEQVPRWLGWHLRSRPFVQDAHKESGVRTRKNKVTKTNFLD